MRLLYFSPGWKRIRVHKCVQCGTFNCCTALLTNLIIEEFPHRWGPNVKTPHPLQRHGLRHLLYPKSSGFLPSLLSKKEAQISGSQSCHWLKNIYTLCVRACVCSRRREGNWSCRKEKPKAKEAEKKEPPKYIKVSGYICLLNVTFIIWSQQVSWSDRSGHTNIGFCLRW